MKLSALELEQFRKFDRPLRLAGMTDGLNLVVGPNEMGKSTLVAALRAVLFERHRSASQLVRSFAPGLVEGAAPRVALTFELGGDSYRIEKRFLKRPSVRLDLPDGRRLEDEPAEDRLQELLGVGPTTRRGADADALGIWSVLWVDQGHAFGQAELPASARATLHACLEAEIDEVVGGPGARALVAAVDAALAPLVTARTARPRGDYRRVADELTRAGEAVATLETAADTLEADRRQLEEALGRRRELRAAAAGRDDRTALLALRGRRDAALERDARVQAAQSAQALAARALAEATRAQAQHQALIEAIAAARRAVVEATAAGATASQRAAASQAALDRLQAEVAGLESEQLESQSRRRTLERLQGALAERESSQAALAAQATRVELALDPKALARVRIGNRRPTQPDRTLEVLDPLEIEIEGIGRLVIRPPISDHDRWRRRLAEAEQRALRALADLGLITPPADAVAGAPPDLLEPGRHRLPERAAIDGALDHATRLVDRLAARIAARRPERDEQLRAWRTAAAAAEAGARLDQARGRLGQLEGELARAQDQAADLPADLAAQVASRQAELAMAQAALDDLHQADGIETLAELDGRIAEREAAIAADEVERAALEATIEGLGSRIEVRAGEALDQRLDEARREQQELADAHARHQREAEVLMLLRTTLAEAEHAAKERYLEPLSRRLDPLLRALLPEAEPCLDDALRVRALRRGPRAEPLAELSAGTREQIAILTRLAFAVLLVDQGRPAMVVLDDALVFADDRRIGRMFEILTQVALRVQILLLTCREQLFEGLPGTRLRLEPADPSADQAARGAA